MKNFKLVDDASLVDSINEYLVELKSLTVSINFLKPSQKKISNKNSKRFNAYILPKPEIINTKKADF